MWIYNLKLSFMRSYTAWKVSKYGVFSGPCLGTFHAVLPWRPRFVSTELIMLRYKLFPCINEFIHFIPKANLSWSYIFYKMTRIFLLSLSNTVVLRICSHLLKKLLNGKLVLYAVRVWWRFRTAAVLLKSMKQEHNSRDLYSFL